MRPFLAREFESGRLGDFLRRLLRDVLLDVGKMRVVVVAHRTDCKAARTVAERADDAQQTLPEAEEIARAHRRFRLFACAQVEEAIEELGDLGEAEFLR